MKKLFFVLFALLFVVGVASATTIPSAVDPSTSREMWITQVYNSDTSVLDVGDCAEWEIGASTGDDKNWVEACDSVDTFLVAGVIWPVDIGVGAMGLMVVKGPVDVDTVAANQEEGSLLCSSATAGSVDNCSDTASDPNALGFATAAGSGNSVKMQVFVK